MPASFAAGALLSKNGGAASGHQASTSRTSLTQAQGARAARAVPNPPGGLVHDFVPFYFAPWSPKLFAINGGRVAGCQWRQGDIVHFQTTALRVVALGRVASTGLKCALDRSCFRSAS